MGAGDDGAFAAFNKGWQAMPKPTWGPQGASSSAAGASSSHQQALFSQEAAFDQSQVIHESGQHSLLQQGCSCFRAQWAP